MTMFALQELREIGVETVWGEPSDVGAAVGSASFDVVLDNNGKTLDVVQYAFCNAPCFRARSQHINCFILYS